MNSRKTDYKEVAAAKLGRLQETLRSYVSVETGGFFEEAGTASPGVSPHYWHLPGDSTPGWALTSGRHNVSSWLADSPLKGGTLSYFVRNFDCGMGLQENLACKEVSISLIYAE